MVKTILDKCCKMIDNQTYNVTASDMEVIKEYWYLIHAVNPNHFFSFNENYTKIRKTKWKD